jgi:hypothetical protein
LSFPYRVEHGALNRVGTSLEIEVADEFIFTDRNFDFHTERKIIGCCG